MTTSKKLDSTRPTRIDREDSRDGEFMEKDVLDDVVRGTRSTEGVLNVEHPPVSDQFQHRNTDPKLAKLRDRNSGREKGREVLASNNPDGRMEEAHMDINGSQPVQGSLRHIDDLGIVRPQEPESKSLHLSNNPAYGGGQDTQADTGLQPLYESATITTPVPVTSVKNERLVDTSQKNASNTSDGHSASLEQLLSLNSGMNPNDLEDSDPEIAERLRRAAPPLPPSSIQPIQNSSQLDVQSLKSDEYLLIASQVPLPQSGKNRAKQHDKLSSIRERARSRSHIRSMRSRPSISPRRRTVPRPVLRIRNKIVRNVASRCPIHNSTLEEAQDRRFLRTLTSTREDIEEWFEYTQRPSNDELSSFGPVAIIYNIIHNDTLDFLLLIDDYLDIITAAADDEIILERNIVAWRRMLWFFGKELRGLSSNLYPFATFLSQSNDFSGVVYSSFIPRQMLQELTESILGIQKRLEITFGTLVSSISVVEARKGIAETESVNRLTELGMFSIFLRMPEADTVSSICIHSSVICSKLLWNASERTRYVDVNSTFMCLKVLIGITDPSTTSISAFFGLGIGITLLSYSVRLIIRSDLMVDVRHGFLDRVRNDSSTPENVPIRTRDAIRFMMRRITRPIKRLIDRFGSPAMYIILGSSPIIPMIVVWSRTGLAGSMKLAISVVFILIIVMVAMGWVIQYVQGRLLSYNQARQRKASSVHDTAEGTDDEEDEE